MAVSEVPDTASRGFAIGIDVGGTFTDLACGDGLVEPLAAARADAGVPQRRTHPEARDEAVDELRRERDLGHQDQRLHAAAQRRGDRLEIHLGLARPGDAFE